LKHLAGDFGVDGVGVVEEWRDEEGEACVEEKPEDEEDEAVLSGIGARGFYGGYEGFIGECRAHRLALVYASISGRMEFTCSVG
jgi:hypothetical protein